MSARQEIVKLTATWINTLAAAIVVAGVIAPISGLRAALEKGEIGGLYIASSLLWFLGGFLVHVLGRAWLEVRYKE